MTTSFSWKTNPTVFWDEMGCSGAVALGSGGRLVLPIWEKLRKVVWRGFFNLEKIGKVKKFLVVLYWGRERGNLYSVIGVMLSLLFLLILAAIPASTLLSLR